MKFTFQVLPEDKEAMYAAMCADINVIRDLTIVSPQFLEDLKSDTATIELSERQLAAVLRGLRGAIDNAADRADDWLRATGYEQSRLKIIAQARAQYHVIPLDPSA
jgi:hypothetical protein